MSLSLRRPHPGMSSRRALALISSRTDSPLNLADSELSTFSWPIANTVNPSMVQPSSSFEQPPILQTTSDHASDLAASHLPPLPPPSRPPVPRLLSVRPSNLPAPPPHLLSTVTSCHSPSSPLLTLNLSSHWKSIHAKKPQPTPASSGDLITRPDLKSPPALSLCVPPPSAVVILRDESKSSSEKKQPISPLPRKSEASRPNTTLALEPAPLRSGLNETGPRIVLRAADRSRPSTRAVPPPPFPPSKAQAPQPKEIRASKPAPPRSRSTKNETTFVLSAAEKTQPPPPAPSKLTTPRARKIQASKPAPPPRSGFTDNEISSVLSVVEKIQSSLPAPSKTTTSPREIQDPRHAPPSSVIILSATVETQSSLPAPSENLAPRSREIHDPEQAPPRSESPKVETTFVLSATDESRLTLGMKMDSPLSETYILGQDRAPRSSLSIKRPSSTSPRAGFPRVVASDLPPPPRLITSIARDNASDGLSKVEASAMTPEPLPLSELPSSKTSAQRVQSGLSATPLSRRPVVKGSSIPTPLPLPRLTSQSADRLAFGHDPVKPPSIYALAAAAAVTAPSKSPPQPAQRTTNPPKHFNYIAREEPLSPMPAQRPLVAVERSFRYSLLRDFPTSRSRQPLPDVLPFPPPLAQGLSNQSTISALENQYSITLKGVSSSRPMSSSPPRAASVADAAQGSGGPSTPVKRKTRKFGLHELEHFRAFEPVGSLSPWGSMKRPLPHLTKRM